MIRSAGTRGPELPDGISSRVWGVMVVVGGLEGPETREEWMLSCSQSSAPGGAVSLGAGKGPRRNHDGGWTTEWVLWLLFGSLASLPAPEGSGLFPD